MSQFTKQDNTPLAVVVITGAVLFLTLGDAAIKGISADLRLWQIFILRSALALPVLLVVLRTVLRDVPLMPNSPFWVSIRSLMLSIMWVFYYAALPHLAFSVAAAAFYTLPLFITLFSALLVGERVGPLGWLAVLLGFIGVIIILRPSSSDFSPIALLPLLSAMLYALAMILTRTKCRGENPVILSAGLVASFIVVGGAASALLWLLGDTLPADGFLSPNWTPLTSSAWIALGLMALAILGGSLGAALAYQIGRPSTVATFDFTYVGFATIWGFVFFAERPDAWTLSGIALIVIAGILALRS